MLVKDQLVVYPAQGVGRIEQIESKEIGGQHTNFYIIRILSTNITVMVPVNNTQAVGLRSLCTKKDVKKVFSFLNDRSDFTGYTGQNWNRRYREYSDKLKSPSLLDVCYVFKELVLISSEKEPSFGERRLREQAMGLISSELSNVMGISVQEVESQIEAIYEDILNRPKKSS